MDGFIDHTGALAPHDDCNLTAEGKLDSPGDTVMSVTPLPNGFHGTEQYSGDKTVIFVGT